MPEILGKLEEPQVESEPRTNPSRGVVLWNVGALLHITQGNVLLPGLGIPTRLSRSLVGWDTGRRSARPGVLS